MGKVNHGGNLSRRQTTKGNVN